MKALFVVDMLKDFFNKDGALYCGNLSRKIIPFVKEKIEEFHKNEDLVVFICDSHEEDDLEFNMFPKHCVTNTEGAEIIDEMPVGKNDIIIKKKRFSAFYGTSLDPALKDHKISEVHVLGVCTSICVMDTVGDLRNRDLSVKVWKKGVADFEEQAHNFALYRMEKIYGAKIC
ncbi:MAG: cysteine hydrolase [Candidatus Aminicenantes bacterium]|nr:MAG: cysteine hydrolase [Candidatus Aminicenantes bacterium]